MSIPEPMPCLLDRCRSPLACNDAGGCKARQDDSRRCYDEAIRACREQGLTPWSKHKTEMDHG